MVRRQRAFLLITALLICLILLLLGMGFVGSQSDRYRGMKRAGETAKARGLAVAGLEDARLKIQNDLLFPPPMAVGQTTFSYGESMTIGDPPQSIAGTYALIIETAYRTDPNYEVILITSTGSVGDVNNPVAQYQIKAELSMKAGASYCHYTHWEDQTAP